MRASPRGGASPWRRLSRRTGARARPTDAPRLLAHLRLPDPAPRSFERRHNSITPVELESMLSVVGFKSLDALIDATVPANIRREVRRCLVPAPTAPALRAS